MRRTWEHRKPIIKLSISPYRKAKKLQEPVKASRYYKYLSEIGAGWNERKAD